MSKKTRVSRPPRTVDTASEACAFQAAVVDVASMFSSGDADLSGGFETKLGDLLRQRATTSKPSSGQG